MFGKRLKQLEEDIIQLRKELYIKTTPRQFKDGELVYYKYWIFGSDFLENSGHIVSFIEDNFERIYYIKLSSGEIISKKEQNLYRRK